MKKLFKRLVVAVLIVATLVTTQYSSVYAQVAQTDQKALIKQYNKYWYGRVYKEYDLVNEWLKSDEAKQSQNEVWGAIGNKQDKLVKNKSVFRYDSYYNCGYYDVDYYTEKKDFSKEDQAFLPSCTITEKNGIITIKFKNLKKFAQKLRKEGVIDSYYDIWNYIEISANKGINGDIYAHHTLLIDDIENKSVLGKVTKMKKWDYVTIDTRYGAYKGKVQIYVVIPYAFKSDSVYDFAKEKFGLDDKSCNAKVCRYWDYIAGTKTVNYIYDKSKNYINYYDCAYGPQKYKPNSSGSGSSGSGSVRVTAIDMKKVEKEMKKKTKNARYLKPNTAKLLK